MKTSLVFAGFLPAGVALVGVSLFLAGAPGKASTDVSTAGRTTAAAFPEGAAEPVEEVGCDSVFATLVPGLVSLS